MPAEKYDFKKYLETLRMSGFQITSFMYSAEELEKPEVIAQVIRNIQNVTNCSREVAIYLTELTKRSEKVQGISSQNRFWILWLKTIVDMPGQFDICWVIHWRNM